MKRWYVIRHVRYYFLRRRVFMAAREWARVGVGLGNPNDSDILYLEAVWRGEA